MRNASALLCAAFVIVVLLAGPAGAASINVTSVAAVNSPSYDLTATYGLADWAYWTSTANPAAGAPSNAKSGGILIGDMSAVGGGALRGSTSTNKPVYDFTYTDGMGPATGSVSDPIGLFNTQLGAPAVTNGAGVQLDVLAPSADPFTIYVWATGYRTTAELTATIDSASVADSYTFLDRFPGRFFTIEVHPDAAGQTMNLQWIMTAQTDVNANASVTGVAVNPVIIPEPATMALLGLAVCSLGGYIRSRRKA